MTTPRKPDRTLQAAMEEARKRSKDAQETFDRKVRRAHDAGNTPAEICRALGTRGDKVRGSLKRQGLTPNRDALFI